MGQEVEHNCHPDPLVSVVIPTYNHESYIRQAVYSALDQKTDFPFEIMIGEDDSSDKTRNLCLELQREFPDKIRLLLNDRKDVIYFKGRPSGAHNFINLVREARGKYISYLEGDDYYSDADRLQKQVDVFRKRQEIRIVCTSVEILDQESGRKRLVSFEEGVFTSVDVAERKVVPFACTLMWINDKSLLFPVWYKKCPIGDFALMMILLNNGNLYALQDCTTVYRVHNRSYYSSLNEKHQIQLIRETIDILRMNMKELSHRVDHFKIFNSKLEYRLFRAELADNNTRSALVHFINYIREGNTNFQMVKRIVFFPATVLYTFVNRKLS